MLLVVEDRISRLHVVSHMHLHLGSQPWQVIGDPRIGRRSARRCGQEGAGRGPLEFEIQASLDSYRSCHDDLSLKNLTVPAKVLILFRTTAYSVHLTPAGHSVEHLRPSCNPHRDAPPPPHTHKFLLSPLPSDSLLFSNIHVENLKYPRGNRFSPT